MDRVRVRTTDGVVVEMERQYAVKSHLLSNILQMTEHTEPIDLLVDSRTVGYIYKFMEQDAHVLPPGYNPLELYFSEEDWNFFNGLPPISIVHICNAANYLEYYSLLELTCKVIAKELGETPRSELSEIIRGEGETSTGRLLEVQREFEWFDDAI